MSSVTVKPKTTGALDWSQLQSGHGAGNQHLQPHPDNLPHPDHVNRKQMRGPVLTSEGWLVPEGSDSNYHDDFHK